MRAESPELKKVEAEADELVAGGFETRQDADESTLFEQRGLGIPGHVCSNCGEEVTREQRRCGLCGCKL